MTSILVKTLISTLTRSHWKEIVSLYDVSSLQLIWYILIKLLKVLAIRCCIYPCRCMSTHFPSVCVMRSNDLYVIDDLSLDQWNTQNNPSYFSGKPGVILNLHSFSVCLQVGFLLLLLFCVHVCLVWFFLNNSSLFKVEI